MEKYIFEDLDAKGGVGTSRFFDTFEDALNEAKYYWNHLTYNEQKKYRKYGGSVFNVGITEDAEYNAEDETWDYNGSDVIVDFIHPENLLKFQLYCCNFNSTELSEIGKELDMFSSLFYKIDDGGLTNKEVMEMIEDLKEVKIEIEDWASKINGENLIAGGDFYLKGDYFTLSIALYCDDLTINNVVEVSGISKDDISKKDINEMDIKDTISLFKNSDNLVNRNTLELLLTGDSESYGRSDLYDMDQMLNDIMEFKSEHEKSINEQSIEKANKLRTMGTAR